MSLNLLVVLVLVGGWVSGRLSARAGLPAVLGMTLWGVLLSLLFRGMIPASVGDAAPFLKTLALVVILLRAGLGIRKRTLRKVGRASLAMGIVPCLAEGGAVMLASRHILSLSWTEAGLMGFILAAVSPAVVVPSMLSLTEKGYGARNDVPTLVLAGASLDDVTAITLFTLFLSSAESAQVSYTLAALSIPYAVLAGIAGGVLLGLFLVWFFERHSGKIRATEKVLLLLGTSLFLTQAGTWAHAAALLGVMTTGFILLERAEPVAHELAAKLGKVWVFAEIVLFVLIGMAVDVRVALSAGLAGLAVIVIGLVFRMGGVALSLAGTGLSSREKIFCGIAYIPKATVQAALGAVPAAAGAAGGDVILAVAVLSIVLTAPAGLIGIRRFGPRLLAEGTPSGRGG